MNRFVLVVGAASLTVTPPALLAKFFIGAGVCFNSVVVTNTSALMPTTLFFRTLLLIIDSVVVDNVLTIAALAPILSFKAGAAAVNILFVVLRKADCVGTADLFPSGAGIPCFEHSPGAIVFSINDLYFITFAYEPGNPCLAQPFPQLIIPTNSILLVWGEDVTIPPPESP